MDRIFLGIHHLSIAGGIILAVVGVFLYMLPNLQKNSGSATPKDERSEKVNRYAVILLFIVAALLRLYRLGTVPGGINQDEAMSVLNARALLETGRDLNGNSFPAEFVAWGNSGQSVLLAYCMIPLMALFGDGLFVVRLVPVFFSLLGLWAFYKLAGMLLPSKAAFAVTLFAAFSPWHFMQSRWALDCNLMGHLWILGILLLMKAMENRKLYYAAAAVFGLSMYSYGISFYTISIFLVIGVTYLLCNKLISFQQMLGCIGIYLLVSLPIDLTMMVNTFHMETISFCGITMPLLSDQVRSQDILLFAFSTEQLFQNLQSLKMILVEQFDHFWYNSNYFFGTIFLCSMPFALIGAVKTAYEAHTAKDTNLRARYMLVWIYILTSLLSGVLTKEVNVNRINFLYYGLMLLVGIGVYTLGTKLHLWSKAVYALFSVNILGFMLLYFTLWANTSGFFTDYEAAIRAAGETGKENCAIIVEYNDPFMAKILTLYEQEIPIRDLHSGSFDQHFTFFMNSEEILEEIKSPKEDTVYVIRQADAESFSDFSNQDPYVGYLVVYE